MIHWILLGILIFALIWTFIVRVRNFKAEVLRADLLNEIAEHHYKGDLELLETLTGKKIPEDKRKYLLTPEGHEIVTWLLDHTKEQ